MLIAEIKGTSTRNVPATMTLQSGRWILSALL